MIGWGQDLPEDEAIGVACGWWPSFGVPSGAYVKLNGDGSGDDHHRRAWRSGTGAVMGLPLLAAEVLGMQPEDFSILYQDTDAGPWDMGSSGSQTTFNNGRAVDRRRHARCASSCSTDAAEQLEAAAADLELAEGVIRVKGSPDQSVAIADLAGSGKHVPRQGLGRRARGRAASDIASRCIGDLGLESFLAPQLITHAAHVKVDRETGVVRVLRFAAAHDSGKIVNRIGADGQVYGGVVMGIGQALTEGTQFDADGRQRNPHLLDYKLMTVADGPRSTSTGSRSTRRTPGRRARRASASRPACPRSGAVANAIAQRHRRARQPPADDARARLGDAPRRTARERYLRRRGQRRGGRRGARRRRPPRRRRHRPRRRRPAGQDAAARRARRHPRHRRAARHLAAGGGAAARRPRHARGARVAPRRPRAASPASPTPRRSSGRTRPAPTAPSAATS